MNVDLIERTLRRIEARPQEFDMASWADFGHCGTTACFAGHAMLESGYQITGDLAYAYYRRPDGSEVGDEFDEGANLLDLTQAQARRLFYANARTPAEMRSVVEQVIADGLTGVKL
jgi:hypothetical protein